jgi:amino acid transporter
MTVLDLLLGRPLASDEARGEQIGSLVGLPVFGLDALSSAAYGPEAALTLLIPLSVAGIAYIVPISASIIVLLTIVYFSYRQTIQAYPGGGGSYTVARQNLGASAGLLAAAALMIDYVLVVAVGVSAGVGALVSAVPKLQPWTLVLCLVILALITLVSRFLWAWSRLSPRTVIRSQSHRYRNFPLLSLCPVFGCCYKRSRAVARP